MENMEGKSEEASTMDMQSGLKLADTKEEIKEQEVWEDAEPEVSCQECGGIEFDQIEKDGLFWCMGCGLQNKDLQVHFYYESADKEEFVFSNSTSGLESDQNSYEISYTDWKKEVFLQEVESDDD